MAAESWRSPLEGDFIESFHNILFSVKGIIHPSNYIIAFPKYIPDEKGERGRGRKKYRKITSLVVSMKYMKENFPQYLKFDPVFNQTLSEIPKPAIRKTYYARKILQKINRKAKVDIAEKNVLSLAKLLSKRAQVSLSKIGISGSIMLGLHLETSDIDLIIYGNRQSLKVYKALKTLDSENIIRRYSKDGLKSLFAFRVKDTRMSFNQFSKIESKKFLQGKFGSREYFIRLLKTPTEFGEKYGDRTYLPMGTIELEAEIENNGESIFTPCTYSLTSCSIKRYEKNVDVKEVVSFRGRFCEQAEAGDKVFIRGKLEKVTYSSGEFYRVIVGESREDLLIPLNVR